MKWRLSSNEKMISTDIDFFKGVLLKKVLLYFFILISFSILYGKEESSVKTYDLQSFCDEFVRKSGMIESFQYKIKSAEADYDKVLAQYFPKIKLTFGMGPHPKYEYERAAVIENKDGGYSFQESKWHKYYFDFEEYGIALRMRGDFVLPIYTFGKFMNGLDAAKAQVQAKEAEAEIGDLKLRKEAALFYWSYVMATEILSFMEPALKQVDEAEEKLKDMLYEEKEGVSQKDLIKLRIEKEKLAYQHKRLLLQVETLTAVISEVLGKDWKLFDSSMKMKNYEKTYDELLDYMVKSSPYSKYLSSGLKAYENLYDLEVCRLLPDFGIVGYYAYKYTSSVYEKNYPDPDSPYNGGDGEIGIGFVFNLNILEQVRNVQKAKAEWKALKYQAGFMKRSVPLLIKQKYNDLKSLEEQIGHLKKVRKYSKGWMTSEFTNYESGFNNTKDLIDAVKTYFENEHLYIQSVFDYNMKIEEIIEYTGAR